MLRFALMVAALIPTTPATPPPTIITIKSSPLCNAVRSVVAPAVAGLAIQDRMLRNGGTLLGDMQQMSAGNAMGWAEMENLRLERLVDKLAHNGTIIHQMLDKLAAEKISDPQEAGQLDALRARLLAVADRQNDALNVLSGTSETMEFNELAGVKNPVAVPPNEVALVQQAFQGDHTVQNAVTEGALEYGAPDEARAQSEKRVMGSLEPVLAHCR